MRRILLLCMVRSHAVAADPSNQLQLQARTSGSRISTEGLSQSRVDHMLQDSQGFLDQVPQQAKPVRRLSLPALQRANNPNGMGGSTSALFQDRSGALWIAVIRAWID
jgi:hypothetical protein